MIKFKVKGANTIGNKFARASKKLEETKRIIDVESGLLISRARNKAPMKTGDLKASAFKDELLDPRYYGFRVGFTKFYAPFQEFGTLKKFSLNAEYKEFDNFAMQFKVYGPTINRKGNRPRRYFLHFYIIARKSILRKTGTVVKNIFK